MTWFKVDDGFTNSKPVLRIPRRYRASAIGLWTLAGAWSAKELTDGYIPEYILEELAGTPSMAAHLVAAELWSEAQNGWSFRNWAKYQPTREQVLADREKEAERKRRQRSSGRSPGGTTTGLPVGHQAESGVPVPSRPDPTRTTSPNGEVKSRETRLPADWEPTDEHRQRAAQSGLDVTREANKFRAHAEEKDRRAKSWNAAFTRWLINAAEYAARDRARGERPLDRQAEILRREHEAAVLWDTQHELKEIGA